MKTFFIIMGVVLFVPTLLFFAITIKYLLVLGFLVAIAYFVLRKKKQWR